MSLSLLIIILCGCCCLASSLPSYNFDDLLAEFKQAISAGDDFNPILNRLNMECRAATSGKSIKTSVAVKEEIIDLLMEHNSTSISFKTPEIQAFQENLVRDITYHGNLFTLEHFETVTSFLIQTSDCNLNEFMGIVTKMLPRMSRAQAKRVIKKLEMAERKMQKAAAQDQFRIYGRFMEIFDSEDKPNDLCALKPIMLELVHLDFSDNKISLPIRI